MAVERLVEQLKHGLDAPICLTWELTYACNLACVHCLSSSGRRDPRELTTAEAKAVLDELHDLQVFYINIGGGEPMIRRDFFEIVEHSIARDIGVKFSTNGAFITDDAARRLAAMDYLDIQISLDGLDAATNDPVRGEGSLRHRPAGHGPPGRRRLRAVQDLDRRHPPQRRPARRVRGAGRRPTAPSCGSPGCGRRAGAPTRWHDLHPTNDQQRADLPLAARPPERAHRRLVLPPERPRRAAARASTCAAPAGSCASSTRSARSTPARS